MKYKKIISMMHKALLTRQPFLITSLKMLQSDWLMKCKDIMIMTLRSAKMIFLDT